MAITQEVFALNDFVQERRRTTSSGTKSRYTVTIDAQPILHNLSEMDIGAGPTLAIQKAIQDQIRNITEVAKPATILRRRQSAQALAAGVRSAKKRYSGGRIGPLPPSGSVRLFNDSGRLATSIKAMQNPKERNWTINVAANRLDPSTFKSMAEFLGMTERLAALVPAIRNPLMVPAVVRAIEDGVSETLMTRMASADRRTMELELARFRARLEAARAAMGG